MCDTDTRLCHHKKLWFTAALEAILFSPLPLHPGDLRKQNCVLLGERVSFWRMRNRFRKIATAGLLCSAVLAGLFTAGCGTTPEVTSYVNPVSGRRTDVLAENLLESPGQSREMLWLNAYRDFSDQYKFKYYLEVIYGAREEAGYLDIGPGRSLTITADGNEMNFVGLGSLSKDEDKGAIFETARYEATADDIYRISRAKAVSVRVAGRNGVVLRDFSLENFDKFRKFADQTGADL